MLQGMGPKRKQKSPNQCAQALLRHQQRLFARNTEEKG